MIYCYQCECGKKDERVLPLSEAGSKQQCSCGKVMERDYAAEGDGFTHNPGNWPMKSEALGVHPSQIGEAKAMLAKKGVDVDYTPDGRAILRTQRHRKQVAEAEGFFDMSGSYGDPQPGAKRRD